MRNRYAVALSLLVGCAGVPTALDALASDASTASDGGACLEPGVYPHLALAGTELSLRVPLVHRCDLPSPLVIELLGEIDDGETAALDRLSEEGGFLLVRPSVADRARIEAIVDALDASMPIDRSRIDVIGSGSGARVAADWLYEGTLAPRGIGLLDYDAPPEDVARPTRSPHPRVWLSTGARGVAIDAQDALAQALVDGGFGGDSLRIRERDTGPGTPTWLFSELWDWLDHARWPEDGPPSPTWVREDFLSPDSLLSLDAMPDGTLLAGSAGGRVFGTNASGKWGLVADLGEGPLVSVLSASGHPLIGSTRGLVRSADGSVFARDAAVPGVGAVIGIAAAGARLYGVTAGGVVVSDDDGATWMLHTPGARLEAIATSPVTGTVLAVGPGSVARIPSSGSAPTTIPSPAALHDVAAAPDGTWWAVGGDGAVLRSTDDGLTFAALPNAEARHDDLYCVSVGSDGAMIAGGARGTVLVSHDGATLTSWPTAGQGFIGAVRWIGPGHALIVGELWLIATASGL